MTTGIGCTIRKCDLDCKFNEYGFCIADGCTLKPDKIDDLIVSRNVGIPFNSDPLKVIISPEVKDQLVEITKNIILEAVDIIPEKVIPISFIEDRIKDLRSYNNIRCSNDAWALQELLNAYSLQNK